MHIKSKHFHGGDRVLLYDNTFLKHPGKLRTHWLGRCIVMQITEEGIVQLQNLDGTPFNRMVNGIRLKSYQDSHTLFNW